MTLFDVDMKKFSVNTIRLGDKMNYPSRGSKVRVHYDAYVFFFIEIFSRQKGKSLFQVEIVGSALSLLWVEEKLSRPGMKL
jgi:hypothetical protein